MRLRRARWKPANRSAPHDLTGVTLTHRCTELRGYIRDQYPVAIAVTNRMWRKYDEKLHPRVQKLPAQQHHDSKRFATCTLSLLTVQRQTALTNNLKDRLRVSYRAYTWPLPISRARRAVYPRAVRLALNSFARNDTPK